jgi:hypothetical protein
MRTLTVTSGITIFYGSLLIASIAYYANDLMIPDDYPETSFIQGSDNGKVILAVNISSLCAVILLLILQLNRLCKNKSLCFPDPSSCEILVWLFVILFGLIILILSVTAFVSNCRSEPSYPCHHFNNLAYFFVLVPIYLSFLTVVVSIVLGISWCAGKKFNCCVRLTQRTTYHSLI